MLLENIVISFLHFGKGLKSQNFFLTNIIKYSRRSKISLDRKLRVKICTPIIIYLYVDELK